MTFYSGRAVAMFSTGVLFGSGLSLLLCTRVMNRLHGQISRLSNNVSDIKRDLKLLKDQLHIQDYKEIGFSITSEDDDRFEEAYGGNELFCDTNSSIRSDTTGNNSLSVELREFFRRVDTKLEGSDAQKEEAYQCLLNKKSQYSHNPDFLWRLAKACYVQSGVATTQGDEENKKKLIYASKGYAESAVEIDTNNANVHKWCAISIGVVGEYEGMQKKIENGFKIKNHIDKAIRLNNADYSTHYMLGRWCYEVYMLTWIERKIAAAAFADPPTATLEEALSAFFQCEKLNPRAYKANMMYIAKCYFQQSNYLEAIQWLKYAHHVSIKTAEDRESHGEITSLTSKYSSYV